MSSMTMGVFIRSVIQIECIPPKKLNQLEMYIAIEAKTMIGFVESISIHE